MRSIPRVKQISFKEKEHPFLLQQMEDLMDLYKMDISGLYKTLLREKHQAVFGAPARRASASTGVLER
jgi:hypothetical protein